MPFDTEQFLDVFRAYNQAVWPAQWVLAALGVAAVALAAIGGARSGALVGAILALLWAWMGIVYHVGFFRLVNPLATVFGVLFVAQAVAFAWQGLVRERLAFDVRADARGVAGMVLVGYALVAYPLLGLLLGHRYPATATFGLPCPTTIFTLGVLAWARPGMPRLLLVVPLLWALIGSTAVVRLGMPEDAGLVAAAIAAAWLLVSWRPRPAP